MTWQRMLAYATGEIDEHLLAQNEYLIEENRVLRDQIKGRLLLTDPERRTLAVNATPTLPPTHPQRKAQGVVVVLPHYPTHVIAPPNRATASSLPSFSTPILQLRNATGSVTVPL